MGLEPLSGSLNLDQTRDYRGAERLRPNRNFEKNAIYLCEIYEYIMK
jgi:hypothetical protein